MAWENGGDPNYLLQVFFFLEGNTTLPETEDPWNIDAYLVHERAHVYSMELRDPQVSWSWIG